MNGFTAARPSAPVAALNGRKTYVEVTSYHRNRSHAAGKRMRRLLGAGTNAGADAVTNAITNPGRISRDHDSGWRLDPCQSSIQSSATRRSRWDDRDLDEHRFDGSHHDLGWSRMELGDIAATCAVLDEVLGRWHVPVSLLDSPRHGRHRRRALIARTGSRTSLACGRSPGSGSLRKQCRRISPAPLPEGVAVVRERLDAIVQASGLRASPSVVPSPLDPLVERPCVGAVRQARSASHQPDRCTP
jgi:hypothetical protein